MNNPNRFFKDIDDTFDVFNNSMMDSNAFFDFINRRNKMTNENKNETMNTIQYEVLTEKYLQVIKISKGTIFENCPWKLVMLKSKLVENVYEKVTCLESFIDIVLENSSFNEDEDEVYTTISDQKYEIFYAMAVIEDIPIFKNSLIYHKTTGLAYKVIYRSLIDECKILVERLKSGRNLLEVFNLDEISSKPISKMNKCKRCGSYAINPHLHGRGHTDKNLCDVCFWRGRAIDLAIEIATTDIVKTPKTELGKKLLELRTKKIADNEKFIEIDDINNILKG